MADTRDLWDIDPAELDYAIDRLNLVPPTPEEDNVVCVFDAKGNLKHRIDTFGCEVPYDERTNIQRWLSIIARKQWDIPEAHPRHERPSFARGAFMYVRPEQAKAFFAQSLHRAWKLQSANVIISTEYVPLVRRAMACYVHVTEGLRPDKLRLKFLRGCVRLVGPYESVILPLQWQLKLSCDGSHFGPSVDADSDVDVMLESLELAPSATV